MATLALLEETSKENAAGAFKSLSNQFKSHTEKRKHCREGDLWERLTQKQVKVPPLPF